MTVVVTVGLRYASWAMWHAGAHTWERCQSRAHSEHCSVCGEPRQVDSRSAVLGRGEAAKLRSAPTLGGSTVILSGTFTAGYPDLIQLLKLAGAGAIISLCDVDADADDPPSRRQCIYLGRDGVPPVLASRLASVKFEPDLYQALSSSFIVAAKGLGGAPPEPPSWWAGKWLS